MAIPVNIFLLLLLDEFGKIMLGTSSKKVVSNNTWRVIVVSLQTMACCQYLPRDFNKMASFSVNRILCPLQRELYEQMKIRTTWNRNDDMASSHTSTAWWEGQGHMRRKGYRGRIQMLLVTSNKVWIRSQRVVLSLGQLCLWHPRFGNTGLNSPWPLHLSFIKQLSEYLSKTHSSCFSISPQKLNMEKRSPPPKLQ